MAIKLHTIIASTRPGRIGPAVATWFNDVARRHGAFDASLVDLADFRLPVFDEPEHPMKQAYRHEHTRKWAASVNAADAFVFVTPEYNYTMPPSLLNALSYLSKEWNYKPAGFVSYGGVSGGLRSAQTARQLVTTMKMMPIPEGVALPTVFAQLGEKGAFSPNDLNAAGAKAMLDEIAKWAGALKPLRQQAPLRLAS
jgi:NAD(P)H-dependent FMN reductase